MFTNCKKKYLIVIPRDITNEILRSQIIDRFSLKPNMHVQYWQYPMQKSPKQKRVNGAKSGFRYAILFARKTDIIYTRDIFSFIKFYVLSKIVLSKAKHIFDVRGLSAEESFMRNKSHIRCLVLQALEDLCVYAADQVKTVSMNLESHLRSRYGRSSISVTPCCVPQASIRQKMLTTKSKQDSFSFIYVGSLSVWQSFEKILELYKTIQGKHRLIIVTRDTKKAKSVLCLYNIEAEIRSGGWETVRDSLDEADFGFVYRESNIVNRTASPVKFLEYTARGVIPIMSDSLGDYSNVFACCGYLVKSNEEQIDLNRLLSLYCQETLNLLHIKTLDYTWENQLDDI